ncbi:MAG: peptidoglycan editing factor PgeF [Saprospiraceae bacterium]
MLQFDQPAIFQSFPKLVTAQSTRHGGISPAPYQSLNLGLHTKDQKKNVYENRRRYFAALGIETDQLAYSHQVHQDQIIEVKKAGSYEGFDALITQQTDVFLSVTIADCTPILIYDAQAKVVAAIHAGWRGTVAQIVAKTLARMQAKYQTQAKNCYAYIGTCIDAKNFEVGAEVAEKFSPALKTWSPDRQKFLIDLKTANQQQLLAAGLPAHQIEIATTSTIIDNHRYFSYRQEKTTTGRMLAVIGMRS